MKNRALVMMQLDVSQDDIQEMNDRFNSGMCDVGTANAVSIALRKRFKAKYIPRVEFASHHNACKLRIGTQTYSLPQSLFWWLRESQNGTAVKPSRFSFAIHPALLKKEAPITEHSSGSWVGIHPIPQSALDQ
ncbi:MAG: hypothetical protein ABF384_12600 [Verrucomicrobiales bacterium]